MRPDEILQRVRAIRELAREFNRVPQHEAAHVFAEFEGQIDLLIEDLEERDDSGGT